VRVLPAAALDWMRHHHGVIHFTRLRSFGVSDDQRARLLARGVLVPVHRGVARIASSPLTLEARATALCLLHPHAVIAGPTAGHLWQFRLCPPTEQVHAVVPPERRLRLTGVDARRSPLQQPEITARADGIRLTSPLRTVCDLAGHLPGGDLASVVEQLLDRHRLRFSTVLRAAQTWAVPGRRGAGVLLDVLSARPPGAAPVDSHLELRLIDALVAAGLPQPVRQHPVTLRSGVVAHGDLGYPTHRWLIEVDHRTWHSGEQAAIDKRRDRLVRLAGFEVDRVSETDLSRSQLSSTVDDLVRRFRQVSNRRPAEEAKG
jgi:hypothetical protein